MNDIIGIHNSEMESYVVMTDIAMAVRVLRVFEYCEFTTLRL